MKELVSHVSSADTFRTPEQAMFRRMYEQQWLHRNFHHELAEVGSLQRNPAQNNTECSCAHGVLQSRRSRNTREPRVKRNSSYFLFFQQVGGGLLLGRRKETENVHTCPGSQDLALWPTCELSSAIKEPHWISNWALTELKSTVCLLAALLLRCPADASVVTFPFSGLAAPLLEHDHPDRRKTREAIWMLIL